MSFKQHAPSSGELLPTFAAGTVIPKLIHQIYFNAQQEMPSVLQENIQKIRAMNPGWEHKVYDDREIADFIATVYGRRVLEYFLRINPSYGAARADLFRYLLMYKRGGVYLDIKSTLIRPLDEVLLPDDVCILSRWRNNSGGPFERWGRHAALKQVGGNEFQQWHIVAAAGHPFLRAVSERVLQNIDRYNPVIHQTGAPGVLWTTGPVPYTLAITSLLPSCKYRLVGGHEELGFVYSIFPPTAFEAHKTIFKHHYSQLTTPVVDVVGVKRVMWLVLGPLQIHVYRRLQRFVDAIERRARRWGFVRT